MNDTLSMHSLRMFLGEYLRDADHLQASVKLATGTEDADANCNENFPHSGGLRDAGDPAGLRDVGLGRFAEQLASSGSKTQPYLTSAYARK